MMHVVGTRSSCEAYEALCRKALELPSRGVHVGGGRHVTIPLAPPGPGWTTAWADVRKHPDRDEYAVLVLPNPSTDKLSAGEVQSLADAEAVAVELDASWKPKDATVAAIP
jgi:hypothetical protein